MSQAYAHRHAAQIEAVTETTALSPQSRPNERAPFPHRLHLPGSGVESAASAGGIFSGAEVPKTVAQAAVFGGVAGEQYDPCYHEACDNIDTVTGQPPASTMNVFGTDPILAQQQADSLNGNALKALGEMSGAVTHAAWYFANTSDVLPSRSTAAASTARFKFEGHGRLARAR
jgi:hypothetical protein